ncbi:hypothetical protein BGX27_003885, partial [Mortierella sp. AM989]
TITLMNRATYSHDCTNLEVTLSGSICKEEEISKRYPDGIFQGKERHNFPTTLDLTTKTLGDKPIELRGEDRVRSADCK